MLDNTQDIRITKTQKSLTLALIALLEKQNFQKISVNDICQEALVSRSTFYAHFEDKYMLLKYTLTDIKKKLVDKTSGKTTKEVLHIVLETVHNNAKVYRNLLFDVGNQELSLMFQKHFIEEISTLLEEKQSQGKTLEVPIEIASLYYAGGIASLILWWISEGFPISVDDMASYQYALLKGVIEDN